MKIILKENVESLGGKGDVVEVRKGYARNYLIPRKIAVLATEGSLKQLELKRKVWEKKEEEKRGEAEKVAKALEEFEVKVVVKSGKERLYGKVTPKTIAEAIAEQKKIEIDRRKIELEEDIKKLGSYPVVVKVHPGVEAKITVVVAQDQSSLPPGEAGSSKKTGKQASSSDK